MYTDLSVGGECNPHDKYYLLWYRISQAKQNYNALSYKLYFDNYSVEFVVVYILTS